MSSPLNIQIASDLHEDMNKSSPLEIHGDLLILAGDISDHIDAWEGYSSTGKTTVAVLGNHEFMHKVGSVDKRVSEFKDRYAFSNVKFLYNEIYTARGVNFIGTTLWTDVSDVPNTISNNMDAVSASGLSLEEWQEEHDKAISFIEDSLFALKNETNIVVTHFSPSFHSVPDRYKGSEYNRYYHSGLEHIIRQYNPLIWIHGHIHDQKDYYIGSTRVIANPRGQTLYKENPNFKEKFIVSLK